MANGSCLACILGEWYRAKASGFVALSRSQRGAYSAMGMFGFQTISQRWPSGSWK